MDGVILFSHGSLLCGSGEALLEQAARLKAQNLAPIVEVGYLNYTDPPFLEAAARCAAQGATRLIITPYFLVPGKFVKVDLPKSVQNAQELYPDVAFIVADAIGFDPLLADALLESARRATPPERWRDDLQRAERFCLVRPTCPLYDPVACPQRNAEGDPPPRPLAPERDFAPGTALLVMVHGSPRPTANEEMFRVVDLVRERNVFACVEVGFLECNAPTIPEAIDACAAQGATEILAVPYFLHTGTHVADDLPGLLEAGAARHPNIAFRMGDYLGRSAQLTQLLAARTQAARNKVLSSC